MKTAWVIMTAMPPTKGHANLIRFAASLGTDQVKVIVATQPHEPWAAERFLAVTDFAKSLHSRWQITTPVDVLWLNKETEQNPDQPGFWEFWDSTISSYGFKRGDIWVTSEPYGAILAERLNGHFIPFDPKRELLPIKATPIRENPLDHFDEIMPEFQRHIRMTVTIFGAESTGKTTLSKELAAMMNGHWFYEWARPYLELEEVGPEITREKMIDIWHGQTATQRLAQLMVDKPFIVQDTDLYSTIGYWEQPHWTTELGPVPEGLISDAKNLQSDLYIITKSNIPFERDVIRYGVDKRESPDEFWLGIADKYDLNYIVLEDADFTQRLSTSMWEMKHMFNESHGLTFDRMGL